MPQVVADLVLTNAFLIKGNIQGKHTRLSKFLDDYSRHFLRFDDATLLDLKTRQRIQTPRVFINMDEIILGHEFLDTGGDYYQKTIAKDRAAVRIRAFYSGAVNLEFAGRVRPGSYEADDFTHRFFVMESPQIRGIDLQKDEDLVILKKLPYIVLNKTQISYLYDFNIT